MSQALIDTLCGKTPEHTPWVPFVGVHGGFITGKDAKTYLQSSDCLYEGISQSILRYKPDGIPVAFDLQVEAEIIGCELRWSNDSPPCVSSHPLEKNKNFTLSIPTSNEGRIPIIMHALRKLKSSYPDITFFGLITGPLTLATHIMGTDLLMKMILKPEEVETLLAFCTEVALRMSEIYAENGADVIATVDPMLSQISPKTFNYFLPDKYGKIFSHIRKIGCFSASFVCGDARKNISSICQTHPDSLFVDENVPLGLLRDSCRESSMSFGGNIPLTSVLLSGGTSLCRLAAAECIYESGREHFILAPGCDLLYNTPPENLESIGNLIQEIPYAEMGTFIAETANSLPKREIQEYTVPNFADMKQVVVDVITLNSQTCAACQYMLESIVKFTGLFPTLPVDFKEHRISESHTLSAMKAFKVASIPSMVIDGKLVFESVVPTNDQLRLAILSALEEKNHD